MSRKLLLAALLVGTTGCNFWYNEVPSPDDLMHAVPWFDHMVGSPAVHPYETAGVPRTTPPGTVPVGDTEPDVGAAWATGNFAVAEAFTNPLAPGAMLARGDTLYGWFCATCHGQAGAGDGLVGRRLGAPPVTSDRAMALSDGTSYALIRSGRGVMGRSGDKIWEPTDRGAVVNYVRERQARTRAAAGGPQ